MSSLNSPGFLIESGSSVISFRRSRSSDIVGLLLLDDFNFGSERDQGRLLSALSSACEKSAGLARHGLAVAKRQRITGRLDVWVADQFMRELFGNFGAVA
jgi:hypothetical protein